MTSKQINEFTNLLHYAMSFLDKKTYDHSLRVMLYVMCNESIPTHLHDDCIITAIAHDLIEDCKISIGDLPPIRDVIADALDLLTKPEGYPYEDYIKEIKSAYGKDYGKIAYWVKMADMKDHLAQKETLTPKLKEKYLEALPFLLP